jgi:hypothetical protein
MLLAWPLWRQWGVPLAWAVYAAHIVFGAGMSGIAVAWNLAPITFAGAADSSKYTGAHVTLTGVRGLIAPLIGAGILKYCGFQWVFLASALVFLTASAGMWWQALTFASQGKEGFRQETNPISAA